MKTLRFPYFLSLLALFATLFGVVRASAQEESAPGNTVTELFRVSKVGKPNVVESRAELMRLYQIIKDRHDRAIQEERAARDEFEGEMVRIIEPVGEKDEHGELHLCLYKGKPAIFSISGVRRKAGISPPLLLEKAGVHETTIVRTVKRKAESAPAAPAPALETVDPGGDDNSFFGIALPDTIQEPKPAPAPTAPSSDKPKYKTEEITEKHEYPKYRAVVSTRLKEGGAAPLNQAAFVAGLQNGEVHTVEERKTRKCQNCGGFKRITDNRKTGRRAPDGKIDCPACSGVGERVWDLTIKVLW